MLYVVCQSLKRREWQTVINAVNTDVLFKFDLFSRVFETCEILMITFHYIIEMEAIKCMKHKTRAATKTLDRE